MPKAGAVIADKLRLEEQIAVGAMGEIWRAQHLRLDKAVAVKLLRTDKTPDQDMTKRFVREAKSASRLDHPNSVGILDFGEDASGMLYLAMELLSGPTLAEVLAERNILPVHEAIDIAAQILAALSAAHNANILHRDIKPSNIILVATTNDDGESSTTAKLCDFGLAKLGDSADTIGGRSQERRLIGTPIYMSPEQAVSARVDACSDLYSFGIVLFEMLTGRPPFEAERAVSVLMKHCAAPVPRPSDLAPQLSPALDRVIVKALSKAKEDRYPSARAFRNALLELNASKSSVLSPSARVVKAPTSDLFNPPLAQIEFEAPIEADETTDLSEHERPNGRKPESNDFERLLPHMRLPAHEVQAVKTAEDEPWFLWERYALSPHRTVPPRGFWLLDSKNHRVGPLTFDELALALRLEAHDGSLERCLVAADPKPSAWHPAMELLDTVLSPGIARTKGPKTERNESNLGPTDAATNISVLLSCSSYDFTGRVLIESSSAALPTFFETQIASGSLIFVDTNALALQAPTILVERGVLAENDLPLLVSDAWTLGGGLEKAARRVSGIELKDHHSTIMFRRLRSLLQVEDGTWIVDRGFRPEPRRPFSAPFPSVVPRLIQDSLEMETMEEALLTISNLPLGRVSGAEAAVETLGFTSRERTIAMELLAADQLEAAFPERAELRRNYICVAFALMAAASTHGPNSGAHEAMDSINVRDKLEPAGGY